MTKDNNDWPGEPGLPLNPQKPGIHWLLNPDNDPIVTFWACDAWELREGATTARKVAQDGWRYLGPCLPPETANALISACEDALAVEIEAGFPDSELADRLRAALAKAKGE